MTRFKLTIEYDGTDYVGWQKQAGLKSVQSVIEQAMCSLTQVDECLVQGSGRTDAGVHATGQVAHVDSNTALTGYQLRKGLNHYLKKEKVVIVEAKEAPDDWHARFSATKRYYQYHLINRPAPSALHRDLALHAYLNLDVEAMRKAASYLIGTHDFTSFRASECQANSPIKTLESLEITQDGSKICFHVSAKSFLHHQVRNFVGSLKLVGEGKWTPEKMRDVLNAKDRKAAGPTAPPQGLYLVRVDYGV